PSPRPRLRAPVPVLLPGRHAPRHAPPLGQPGGVWLSRGLRRARGPSRRHRAPHGRGRLRARGGDAAPARRRGPLRRGEGRLGPAARAQPVHTGVPEQVGSRAQNCTGVTPVGSGTWSTCAPPAETPRLGPTAAVPQPSLETAALTPLVPAGMPKVWGCVRNVPVLPQRSVMEAPLSFTVA